MKFTDLDVRAIEDTTIFLDIDGTFVADGGESIAAPACETVAALARANDVFLASNGPESRTKRLAGELQVGALPRLRKPFSRKATRSIARRDRVLVIGDKFLTDGLFALYLGAEFVEVEPLRAPTDGMFARLTYGADRIVSAIAPFISLARPAHYLKNVLVFAPLFFSGSLFVQGAFGTAAAAFVGFSVAASAVYVLNDLFDRVQDAQHPVKRRRPLASGRVSVRAAYRFLALLVLAEVILLAAFPFLAPVLLVYILLNGAYSSWFKHIAVVDILCVAVFYLLRLVAGSAAINVPLSPWIVLCLFFIALFLVVGKRRAEFRHETKRKVLEAYSREALDFMLASTAALTIMSYGLYSVLGHPSPLLVYSTIFVTFALFRILNRIYTHPDQAEAPERLLLRDPAVFLSFVAWALYLFGVFYWM